MHRNFGLFRNEERMLQQQEVIAGLRERYRKVLVEDKGRVFNNDLTQALELGSLLDLAACMLEAGVARKESRGAHSRPQDYPDRDDENFLRHSVVHWRDGAPKLGWKPVTITKWQPAERTY
jgi:succinate dehydrogenase/fumarate reductase flavoprotein subunit